MIGNNTHQCGTPDRAKRALSALLGVTMLVSLTGCGSDRSAESFCETYRSQKASYVDKYTDLAGDVRDAGEEEPLAALVMGLAGSAEAYGDVIVVFDELGQVAPPDIQTDVETIHDSLVKNRDSAGEAVTDPAGAIVGSMVTGLTTAGSWRRVGDYVVETCGGA